MAFFFSTTGSSGWPPEGRGPRRRPKQAFSSELTDAGLTVFLVSLGVLFSAALIGYGMTRYGTSEWIHPWSSTTLAYAAGATLALWAADYQFSQARRRELVPDARRAIGWGLAAVLGYVGLQSLMLHDFNVAIRANRTVSIAALAVLTSLHALHVVGGGLAAARCWWRMGRTSERTPGPELARLSRYWRFLTYVWAVLWITLVV